MQLDIVLNYSTLIFKGQNFKSEFTEKANFFFFLFPRYLKYLQFPSHLKKGKEEINFTFH